MADESLARPWRSRPSPQGLAHNRLSPLDRRRRRAGWFLAVPALVVVLGVLWVPITQAIYYSLTSWNGSTAKWIGFANYRSFFDSPSFWRVVINNLLLLSPLPVIVLAPLAMADLVHRAGRSGAIFRTLFFMPAALSWVVTATVGKEIFAPQGPLNGLLRAFGLKVLARDWLASGPTAMAALLISVTWALFGVNLVIYLSGLSTLDPTIREAARLDGANGVQTFLHIVVPVLSPFVRFVSVLSVTTMYATLFAFIYVLTGGGPAYSTTTLEFFVYNLGFNQFQYGAAAAAGVLLLGVMLLVNAPYIRRFVKRG